MLPLTPELQATTVVVAYLLLCWVCLRKPNAPVVAGHGNSEVLVGYASQTGGAEDIARQVSEALVHTGPSLVKPLNKITEQELRDHKVALFVASTYGEGEPPDNALSFYHKLQRFQASSLSHLRYAVLALGDKSYSQFCAFGKALDSELLARGGQPMFDRVDVDRLAQADIRRWQERLLATGLINSTAVVDASADQTTAHLLPLVQREHLNPGSPGGALFHLQFSVPKQIQMDWQAGDIAKVTLPMGESEGDVQGESEQAARQYSIASLASSGCLDLIVRLVNKDDGSLGLGSGYLCRQLALGDCASIKIGRNASFHAPESTDSTATLPTPPMIFIGNGSGLAGLRAHVLQRQSIPEARNWLIYGERTRQYDSIFKLQLQQWQQSGGLTRLDCVYSRDADGPRYVQDLLAQQHEQVTQWVDDGALIYVCGSQQGMAPAVHRVLVDIIGEQRLEQLSLAGRYRRDIY